MAKIFVFVIKHVLCFMFECYLTVYMYECVCMLSCMCVYVCYHV